MARLRCETKTVEVISTLSPDELRRMVSILDVDGTSALPVVPVAMRATGEAAIDADAKCLSALAANAAARASSWAGAAQGSLGL